MSLLIAFLISAFSAIWIPERWEPKCCFGFVLLMMAVSQWRNRANPDAGLDQQPSGAKPGISGPKALNQKAWVSLGVFTTLAVAALWAIGFGTGAFRGDEFIHIFDRSTSSWLQTKLPTILGQQVMLQLLLLPILIRLLRSGVLAVLACASIFSLLHLPNPVLVLLTFVAGVFWVGTYFRARRLAPVVISHCVLAMMAAGLCGEYILNLRVGPQCADLLPRAVETDDGRMYEFPGCTVGVAERLVQRNGSLFLEGWAYDSIHHCSPARLYLNVDEKLRRIEHVEFTGSPSSHWKNAHQSGFVGDTCYSFKARIPTAWFATPVETKFNRANDGSDRDSGVQLFAANVNGSLTRIPCQGEISPIPNLRTDQDIVLFPVEVDGRINVLDQKQGDVQLKGWTADLNSHAIPKRMYVEFDGSGREVNIHAHRVPRPDVAKALQDPNLAECGFDVPIGEVDVSSASQIRCFVVDDQQQLHPIELTETAIQRASVRVAEQPGPEIR